jgi:hypothetical protein
MIHVERFTPMPALLFTVSGRIHSHSSETIRTLISVYCSLFSVHQK